MKSTSACPFTGVGERRTACDLAGKYRKTGKRTPSRPVPHLNKSMGEEFSPSEELFNYGLDRLRALRSSPAAPCKICAGEARPFDLVDFNKCCEKPAYQLGLSDIPVVYRICSRCLFVFTDFFDSFTPEQWRRHIYNDDYARVDPEYERARPRENVRLLTSFLVGRKHEILGLDYGGGNGTTAEMMRRHGWTFDCCDPFARTDIAPERVGHYNFCSAIEVFEHTTDPAASLQAILKMASSGRLIVMIATGINDWVVSSETRLNWWYAAPRNGHVSLYSSKSLQMLGERFGLQHTALRGTPTFLTRGYTTKEARNFVLRGKMVWRLGLALAA